jgi:D-sedoheptulose 7-phosphate isomerase
MLRSLFATHAAELQEVLGRIGQHEATLSALSTALYEAFQSGHKLLTCGNGGSSAEAAHLAEEFTGRFWRERPSLPGMCLSIDGTVLTCIVNDYGADEMFARQISSLGSAGDVLVVFSSSGNSPSILRALEVARERKLVTAAFLGKGGGPARGMADYEIIIESDTGIRVQECHVFLLHMLCESVERRLLNLDEA